MAEQRIGKHDIIETTDIDGNEFARAPAGGVNRARYEFLARSGLSGNQYRPRACGYGFDIAEYEIHVFTHRHNIGERFRAFQSAGHHSRLECKVFTA